MRINTRSVLLFFAATVMTIAQNRPDRGGLYQRVYAIVPIVGAGTWEDPKRPLFSPAPSKVMPGDRTGIIAYNHQLSDDGNFALVEYVLADTVSLASVLGQLHGAAGTRGVQIFERGKATPAQIEAAFQAKKKGFDLKLFRVVAQ